MTNKLITTVIIIVTMMTTVYALAAEQLALKHTVSINNIKKQWDQNQAIAALENKISNPQDTTKVNVKTGKTREQVLQLKQQLNTAKNKAQLNASNENTNGYKAASNYHHSFSIFQAYSQLIEDFDEDGFYQTFSVTFDADVYDTHGIDHAVVYAELYLSKNGGDWVHYYTTDDFSIFGESEDDEYEVYTTLNQGYAPDGYDVLIDLYEVGYDDIVATYSSDDSNTLYDLPLESTNYDPVYVERHSNSHGHGGSTSSLLLFLTAVVLLMRKLKQLNK